MASNSSENIRKEVLLADLWKRLHYVFEPGGGVVESNLPLSAQLCQSMVAQELRGPGNRIVRYSQLPG